MEKQPKAVTMSQRRSATKNNSEGERTIILEEAEPNVTSIQIMQQEVKSLSLETDGEDSEAEMLHLTKGNDNDPVRKQSRRVQKWKESPFAVGLTEPTWMEERTRDSCSRTLPPDETGCLCFSAFVCPLLGAERVGNMAVLRSSQEWTEEVEDDKETGQATIRRYSRPRIDMVVGPYWPMLCFITYPIILGISGWTLLSGIMKPGKPLVLIFVWTILTLGLIVALALTAFRDPGIMYRNRNQLHPTWRWTDEADTYRHRHAWFDSDTAVVIEGFDHT